MFMRPTNDQTLGTQPESARYRGRGRDKAVYAFATGADADVLAGRLIARVRSTPGSGLGATRT